MNKIYIYHKFDKSQARGGYDFVTMCEHWTLGNGLTNGRTEYTGLQASLFIPGMEMECVV